MSVRRRFGRKGRLPILQICNTHPLAMVDLESPRLDTGSGSDLLFYIELDAPGNSCCSTNVSLLRLDLMSVVLLFLWCKNGFNILPLTCCHSERSISYALHLISCVSIEVPSSSLSESVFCINHQIVQ